MVPFWAAAIVIFMAIEWATAALTTTWFAVGSLAALIAAYFGAMLWLQIFWFVVVSLLVLWKVRPLVLKYVNNNRQPTNADRVIGQPATVIERIDNLGGTGYVAVGSTRWMARTETGEPVEKDAVVTVIRIEGAKLIVAETQEETANAV